MTLTHRGFLLASLLCAASVCALFLPGLPGDFVFDDSHNIVQNTGIQLQSLNPAALLDILFSTQFGGATRVVPTLTFALDYFRGDGLDPATFKTTNIAIHALTTLVLAWFLRSVLLVAGTTPVRARWMALAMALAWAAHPLQVSSVLYVVQRMQTLETLFMVLALCSYLKARHAQMAGRPGRTGWMLAGLLWVVAFGCKEDAILLPAYTLALELTVLRFRAGDPVLAQKMKRGYLIMALLGAAAFALVVVPHYWSWDAYPNRNFSSLERLVTQGRVLCMYLWEILLPLPSHMPFYYDWFQPSRGLLHPWTTLPALLFLFALLASAWRLRHARPLFALGVLLFFAGHFVTSNVIGLELAFEHRNHFPLIGVVLAVGDLLALTAGRFKVSTTNIVAACVVLLMTLGGTTIVRSRSWDSGFELAQTSTRLAPGSARAWNTLCVSYFELGGGAKADNPNLDKAIAACGEGAAVANDSITSLTNIMAFKAIQGSVTEADWDRYLAHVRRVTMTPENSNTIWVLLNQVRNGSHLDENHVLETIDIFNQRAPFKAIESAAMGYFILGHTRQPARAYSYFARAVETTTDPSFAEGIAEDLRKEGHPGWAGKLEALATERDRPRSPP